jgi:hypothetical protein
LTRTQRRGRSFARAELTDAQRADHHARREEILKRKGLVSSGPGRKNSENSSQLAYARQAAETLGISKRTVEKDLARGKKVAPEVLAEVTGSDLDRGVVLDELARTPRELQAAKVAEIGPVDMATPPPAWPRTAEAGPWATLLAGRT